MSQDSDLSPVAVPSTRPRPCVALVGLVPDTRGVAALELALVLPFMILLLMGIFDFANVAYYTMQVNAAAYAGAHAAVAAVQNSQACTNSVITSAEVSATSLGSKISTSGAASGQGPNCSYAGYVNAGNSGAYSLSTTCSGTCPIVGAYAVAYAQATYTPLLSWSALVLPKKISATAMVRYG